MRQLRNSSPKVRSARFSAEPLEPRRLMSAGGMDLSFGTNGLAAFGPAGFQPNDIEALPDGSTIAVGSTRVARFTSAGKLDTSFGTNGIVMFPLGASATFRAVSVGINGKIVVAGYRDSGTILGRLNANGTPDTTFGTAGWVQGEAGQIPADYPMNAEDVDVAPNGRIFVTGDSGRAQFGLQVAAWSNTGQLVTSFGGDGVVSTGGSTVNGRGVIAQANRILVSATTVAPGGFERKFVLSSFDDAGNPSAGFTSGIVNAPTGGVGFDANLAAQSTGKLVIAGSGGFTAVAVRLNSNGTVDTTFGANGVAEADMPNPGNDSAADVAVDAQDRIVLVGDTNTVNGGDDLMVARLLPNGALDTAFGDNGFYSYTLDYARGHAIAVDFRGDVIVSGFRFESSTNSSESLLIRLYAEGGEISGRFFYDLNKNGAFEAGEFPVANRVIWDDVNLTGVIEGSERAVVTDAEGRYTLGGLAAGDHVAFTVKRTFEWFRPPTSAIGRNIVNLTAGQARTNVHFALEPSFAAHVRLFDDLDRDGVVDDYEPGVLNGVFADDNNNGVWDFGEQRPNVTGAGYALFTLPFGTHRIRQEVPTNRVSTTPNPAVVTMTGPVPSPDGGQPVAYIAVAIGSTAAGAVTGTVFNDVNGDGIGGSESGIAGRTVFLDVNNNTALDPGEPSAQTATVGAVTSYRIQGVLPGTYAVRTVMPPGWVQTWPFNNATTTVNVTTGGAAQANFGQTLVPAGTGIIQTGVFPDENGDGENDRNDYSFPIAFPDAGWTLYLDADLDGSLDAGERSSVSDDNGLAPLIGVPAGTHRLRAVAPAGYEVSSPAAGFRTITVTAGQAVLDYGFGGREATAPQPVTLRATADAHVRDGSSAGQNFGDAVELQLKRSDTAGSNREFYLRFDLTGVPSVAGAKLRLNGRIDSATQAPQVAVYPVGNVTWAENTINWNNRPAAGTAALATQTVATSTQTFYEWDVSGYVAAEKAAGRNAVTLLVRSLNNTDPYLIFASDEAAANRPELVVTPGGTPPPAPQVTKVFVGATGWAAGFLNHLDSTSLGDAVYGYAIDPANPTDELPWTNLNKVSVRFSRDVNVAQANLVVTGAAVAGYATSAFAYDPLTFTATWTLATAGVGPEKLALNLSGVTDAATGAALDGEWPGAAAGAFPSGDGIAGGAFRFRMNVLPGDVNRNGGILGNDVTLVRNAQGFAPGTVGYSIFRDVNGSGSILGNDVTLVRNRQGFTLPTEEPPVP